MKPWFFASAGALALVMTGLVQGTWIDRWAPDGQTARAAELLANIPMRFGEWDGKDIDVKPGQAGAGVTGCLQRTYFNRRLGVTVIIALVNGRPGPVSTHTPEACYGASGYSVGKRSPLALDTKGDPAQFWTADAVRSRVTEETRLRIFWAWNGSDGWYASTEARNDFPRFRYPVLHKLYVLREIASNEKPANDREEPCRLFLDTFVPILEETLFRQNG